MKEYVIYQAGGCGEDLVLRIKDSDKRKKGPLEQRAEDVKTLIKLFEDCEMMSTLFVLEFFAAFFKKYPTS